MDMVKLRSELAADEGRRHVPYRDQFGNWTCGIGHLMGRDPYPHEYWSDIKIDATFEGDVAEIVDELKKQTWWGEWTDPRQRAIVNLAFNLGLTRLSHFTTFLKYVGRQDWKMAGADLRNTLWYREVPARAERIIKLLAGG